MQTLYNLVGSFFITLCFQQDRTTNQRFLIFIIIKLFIFLKFNILVIKLQSLLHEINYKICKLLTRNYQIKNKRYLILIFSA